MKQNVHRWMTLLALLLGLAFQSCGPQGPPPEELLVRSWKLKTLHIENQPPPPPQIMALSSFNFHKNGRYEILLGELERGTWRLSEDKKVLITVPDGGMQEQHIDIEELTATTLTLTNRSGASPIHMELVPE